MKNQNSLKKKIICTDLDGTFIGDDRSMHQLLKIIEKNNLILVFNTGRDIALVKEFIKKKKTGNPDSCLCQVGTEVFFLQREKFVLDKNWSKIISFQWQKEKIKEALKDIKELIPQAKRWQTEFKLSYFLTERPEKILKKIRNRLNKSKLKVKIIYSSSRFLDFLPVKSGKAEALKYIAKKFNLKKPNIIVCGNSGNDLDFFEAGFKGIIVGNAQKELKQYRGKNAYQATKKYSAGIIEGLKYFNFI